MRRWGIAVLACCGAASACQQGEPNVYDMPVQQAYAKLVDAPVVQDAAGVFGIMGVNVSGDGASTVYWRPTGDFGDSGEFECRADLAPAVSDRTRVMAECSMRASLMGVEGAIVDATRSRLIEHIDATLRGRPFDSRRAMGSTASGWPTVTEGSEADNQMEASQAQAFQQQLREAQERREQEQ